jgi:hypothetical protein
MPFLYHFVAINCVPVAIFAMEAIPSGTYIGTYAGEILRDEEGEKRGM